MIEFYTAVVIIECLALGVLGALVWDNRQLSKAEKARFSLTYAVLCLAAIAEWLAIFLNGSDESLRGLHIASKCLDYILSPMVAVFFVRQVAQLKKLEPFFGGILGANAILQIISCFTGWTFYIDANGVYQHGFLHPIYIGVYIVAIIYVILGFVVYAKHFPKQNFVSFVFIVLLAVGGIAFQEFAGDAFAEKIRTGSLCLVFCSVLLYIHYVSFSQQQKDLDLAGKEMLLRTDALSGCLSRYAYNQAYNALLSRPMDDDLAVMFVDLNGLKKINDQYGHEAGDDYIRFAGSLLQHSFHAKGECFRTGGDEFLIFLRADEKELQELVDVCQKRAADWKSIKGESMSLAIGYASRKDNKDASLEKLISLADEMMYAEKKRYYENTNNERRH